MNKVKLLSILIFSFLILIIFLWNIPDLVNNAIFSVDGIDRPSFLPYDGFSLLQQSIYNKITGESSFSNWTYVYTIVELVGDDSPVYYFIVSNLLIWISAIIFASNTQIRKTLKFQDLCLTLIILFPPFAFGAVFVPSKDLVSYSLSIVVSSLYVQAILSNKKFSISSLLLCTSLLMIAILMRNQLLLIPLFIFIYKLLRRKSNFKVSLLWLSLLFSATYTFLFSFFSSSLGIDSFVTTRGVNFNSLYYFSLMENIHQAFPPISFLTTIIKGILNILAGFTNYFELSSYFNWISLQDKLTAALSVGFFLFYFKKLKLLNFNLVPNAVLHLLQEFVAVTYIAFLVFNLAPYSQIRYNWSLLPLLFGLTIVVSMILANQKRIYS